MITIAVIAGIIGTTELLFELLDRHERNAMSAHRKAHLDDSLMQQALQPDQRDARNLG